MLNPSVADASADDPTIRRVRGFSESWGFGGFTVVNLFAEIQTNPAMMGQTCDPVGPENDDYIAQAAEGAKRIVCAWGAGVLPEHMSGPRRSWRCFSARPCVVSGPPKMDIPGIRSTCGGIKSLCPMECFRRWRSRSMEDVKIIRKPKVTEITSLSQSTIRRLEMAGKFPKRVKISEGVVGWIEREVVNWVESRKNASA